MSLRHALLGLLVDRSASGYDLMKLFDTSLANVWPATQSQVYGELNRLDATGLIEVVAEGPRGRKEYGLTEPGREELRRWLTEDDADKPQRNESLLQVFFLGVLPREQAVEHLSQQADTAAAQRAALVELNEAVDWGDNMLSVNSKLALEYGLRQRAMEEEWARWAAEQVRNADRPDQPADKASGP
ncbi:PadR family transcriptional regulator [Streptomyces sp. AK02-01A]|uniref:PadR family transcriptional regulator n=1 Tax=Streptomyces sp. AK02-01A TaxID=3028648 RepID=UPI0029B249B9|nr:PadR family transcriptional regulator [Streptomyces sp. AK02-01A]MDX3854201.1 PadR family transcriptional regulator [Streptomyces sp. AK02-01A]